MKKTQVNKTIRVARVQASIAIDEITNRSKERGNLDEADRFLYSAIAWLQKARTELKELKTGEK